MQPSTSFVNKYQLLRQIQIFQSLNWWEMQRIARKANVVEYQKGELIRKQGDPADAIYCLVSGRVQAYRRNAYGDKEGVEFIHRGMHFGIISLFTGEEHSLNFEVINDSLILQIEREDFLKVLKSVPRLGLQFSENLSQQIRDRVVRKERSLVSTIISVYAPVKGTGSSTYAFHLALSLWRETVKRVIYLNINSITHGSVTTSEIASGQPGTSSPVLIHLNEIIDDYEKIKKSIHPEPFGIDVLHVVFDPEDTSLVNQISYFVTAFFQDYDYIVVDLPNEMDRVVLKTLTQSDIVQLLTLDQKQDLSMTRHCIDQLEQELKENFHQEKIQVIISGIQPMDYLSFEEVNQEIDYQVTTKLPHIPEGELELITVTGGLRVYTSSSESEYSRAITRMARRIGHVLVGLVLGGGAALGIAHVGVIQVLEKERIPIDMVVGSSMGALIASLWTIGNDGDALEKIANEFSQKKDLLKLFDPIFPISGLVGGQGVHRWLRRRLGDNTFYSTKIPLKIVAYDLLRRQELVFQSGPLVDAVLKSIAIPGVIKPVLEKDQMIIDGGVMNPLPTNVCRQIGVNKIIAVNVLQSPHHVSQGFEAHQMDLKKKASISFRQAPWHYLTFRLQRFFSRLLTPNIPDIIVQTLQASEYVIAQQSASQADVVIVPDLTGINWFELFKVKDLIKRGEEATYANLPQIKELVKIRRETELKRIA